MIDLKIEEYFAKQQEMFKSFKAPKFPLYDISENEEGDMVVEMACSGFDKEAFKVGIEKGMMHVSGMPQKASADKAKEYLVKNLSSKGFKYAYPMWLFGEVKSINCSYEDGVLRVVLAKKAEDKISVSWTGNKGKGE